MLKLKFHYDIFLNLILSWNIYGVVGGTFSISRIKLNVINRSFPKDLLNSDVKALKQETRSGFRVIRFVPRCSKRSFISYISFGPHFSDFSYFFFFLSFPHNDETPMIPKLTAT